MPILYETPGPFAPGISSAYGAAQQFSQDAPMIAGLAERTAALQQSGLGRADQLRFAYAHANAEQQNQAANRYAASEAANANRQQQGLDLGAQLESQANANMLHANTQLAAQQQGAQLQAWLGQQDLSQRENMRLQQARNTMAEADMAVQNGQLAPDQAEEVKARAWHIAGPLDQRLKQQHAREFDSISKQRAAQATQITREGVEAEEFWASRAQNRTKPVYDQGTLDQVAAELDAQGLVLSPQERDRMVKEEAAARGGLIGHQIRHSPKDTKFYPTDTAKAGKETKTEHPSGLNPAEYRKEYSETVRRVEGIAAKEPDRKDENGNPYWTRDKIKEEVGKDMMELHGLPANFEEYKKMTPPAQGTAKAQREPWGGRFNTTQAPKLGPALPAAPGNAPAAPENAPTASFPTNIAAIQARADLAPAVKNSIVNKMHSAAGLLERVGGDFTKLDDVEKRYVVKVIRDFNEMPKAAAPQPPPAPHGQTEAVEALRTILQDAHPFNRGPQLFFRQRLGL